MSGVCVCRCVLNAFARGGSRRGSLGGGTHTGGGGGGGGGTVILGLSVKPIFVEV